ncbi:LmbE family protein [Amycolatopsis mediterranei S699]|uniref:Mycothiol S-conjugate amidase n=2 Tax=Amycolatopsis mediterranei TaxID=33910 RepID=A0A0H3CVA5_AMYMU|nr:mycothiol conjugate amidase Mca [Amycolatopsis mediterranei]ADJ41965.1 LmbE family protein [Amycolatopsis mediterranei U32]AEK38639.1 mycothiol conjugate amidase Mca [Amycolatopsis mediterranei S699]AFO73675.1 LmbE family protein [Amycolatopsis mediterranei S699]AGT80804.1 LmbE family protein [Amycolatopsis mediterranei RB]KDO08797.1 GlcNAc-PI de-N-acetylase [Amycolatopsis mediterranei]
MTYRLLSVHAHPDDESSKCAATLARYAAEGVEVLVATCTGGERGDVLNPALDTPETWADLPAIRRREMAAAAEILGVRQRFLGLVDSGLPAEGEPLPEGCFAALPLSEAAAPLVALIREFRPHVVITYDETGGYPHPDHIRTHEVTVEAFTAAADPARYPGTGEPWQPQKLYYQATLSRAWFQALHEATLAAGLESSMAEVLNELPPDKFPVTTKIRCEAHFATRDRALLAHATQVDPAHPFFAHSREIERQVWPHEDYHLAHPAPGPHLEEDLFTGVTP